MPRDGAATVVSLLLGRSPTHVAGLVIAVVVDAVKRVARRLRPHVREKRQEVAAPLVAHTDSATAVTVKLSIFGVMTPLLRLAPGKMFRGEIPPMTRRVLSGDLAPKTPTAPRSTVAQVSARNINSRAAIAEAAP